MNLYTTPYHDSKGRLLALVVRGSPADHGCHFVTEPAQGLQLGLIRHPPGHVVAPHEHLPVERRVVGINEVLYLKSGLLEVTLLGDGWEVTRFRLFEGDLLLLAAGGHAIEVIKEAELIEVKNGPFVANDKKYLSFPSAGEADEVTDAAIRAVGKSLGRI